MKSPLPLMILCAAITLAAPGCGTFGESSMLLTTSAEQPIDSEAPLGAARQDALLAAEDTARGQLLEQIYTIPLNDGRNLGELAIVDSSVNGVILDTVATAGIGDRHVDDDGVAHVTLAADLAPLYKMIATYQGPAV